MAPLQLPRDFSRLSIEINPKSIDEVYGLVELNDPFYVQNSDQDSTESKSDSEHLSEHGEKDHKSSRIATRSSSDVPLGTEEIEGLDSSNSSSISVDNEAQPMDSTYFPQVKMLYADLLQRTASTKSQASSSTDHRPFPMKHRLFRQGSGFADTGPASLSRSSTGMDAGLVKRGTAPHLPYFQSLEFQNRSTDSIDMPAMSPGKPLTPKGISKKAKSGPGSCNELADPIPDPRRDVREDDRDSSDFLPKLAPRTSDKPVIWTAKEKKGRPSETIPLVEPDSPAVIRPAPRRPANITVLERISSRPADSPSTPLSRFIPLPDISSPSSLSHHSPSSPNSIFQKSHATPPPSHGSLQAHPD
eukprot:TRINITY_DN4682_c0_g2_i2.p1 TRINITY_DN4682_c0_g2~~TRINITY_DN4682_c0_g2_i2.p1  ORF type:complete len:386 (+),score=60.71 TRINITY_DN4682_c0_g2_i2:82-1158(+)